jgi:hypothetical protein
MDSTSATLLERLRQPDARDAWSRFVQLYTPGCYVNRYVRAICVLEPVEQSRRERGRIASLAHAPPSKVIVCFTTSSFGTALPSISWETNFQVPWIFFSKSLPMSTRMASNPASASSAAPRGVPARLSLASRSCRA